MKLEMLLEMAADGMGERVAVGSLDGGLTYAGPLDEALRLAGMLRDAGAERLVLVDLNSDVVPTLLFGSALAGIPFVPLNHRVADEQLRGFLERTRPALAVVHGAVPARVGAVDGVEYVEAATLRARLATVAPADAGDGDPDGIAVLLFTSGTTGEPKAAVLRHRHLTSYVLSTVEFMGIVDGQEKSGRRGPLLIVTVAHEVHQDGRVVVTEEQDLVYLPARSADTPAAAPRVGEVAPVPPAGWTEVKTIDRVTLFRLSAVTFNSHRIHYDVDYARSVEGYPRLVVHGPLTLLVAESAAQALGRPLTSIEFCSSNPLFEGTQITLVGTPSGRAHLSDQLRPGQAERVQALLVPRVNRQG